MKPSNTGIDWMDDRGISPEELASAVAACDLEVERFGRDLFSDPSGPFIEYLDLCYIVPAIVRLAIAEYRKELAARAEKRLTRYYPNGENDMGASDYGEYYERAEVLSLLNENDDAE